MLSMYALGIIAAVGTAFIFKRTMLKGAPAAFILELPTYKVPQASEVVRQVWKNTSEFVKKAGTVIFCMSVILWALAYYPRLPEAQVRANRVRQAIPSVLNVCSSTGAADANKGSTKTPLTMQRSLDLAQHELNEWGTDMTYQRTSSMPTSATGQVLSTRQSPPPNSATASPVDSAT